MRPEGEERDRFLDLAKSRFSVRKYKDIPVEDEKIEMMLEAAKVAPSARNYQPSKVYVVKSEEKRKALAQVCPCTFDAPVIFVVTYCRDRVSGSRVAEGHNFGETDSAIVTAHLMFEAADLGLGSCWVGMFVSEEVKQALGLPEGVEVRHLLPVGYAADDSVPSASHTAYRPREEVVEFL